MERQPWERPRRKKGILTSSLNIGNIMTSGLEVMDTGPASRATLAIGSRTEEDLHAVSCSAAALLSFLICFEHRTPHFHVAPVPTNYITSPEGISMVVSLGEVLVTGVRSDRVLHTPLIFPDP